MENVKVVEGKARPNGEVFCSSCNRQDAPFVMDVTDVCDDCIAKHFFNSDETVEAYVSDAVDAARESFQADEVIRAIQKHEMIAPDFLITIVRKARADERKRIILEIRVAHQLQNSEGDCDCIEFYNQTHTIISDVEVWNDDGSTRTIPKEQAQREAVAEKCGFCAMLERLEKG
jgi:hypothetical protein